MENILNNLNSNEYREEIIKLINDYNTNKYQEYTSQYILDMYAFYSTVLNNRGIVEKLLEYNRNVTIIEQSFFQELVEYLTTEKHNDFTKYLMVDNSKRNLKLKLTFKSDSKVNKRLHNEFITILKKGGIKSGLIILILLSKYFNLES